MKSLQDKRIVLLRTPEQGQEMHDALIELGAEVILCPVIKIVPIKKALKTISLSFVKKFTTVIFTSANGVQIFMNQWFENHWDARKLSHVKIITVGSKTALSLKPFGIIPDAVPDKFVAEGILHLLDEDLRKEAVLIPTAQDARPVLPEELRKRGAIVEVLPIYKTVRPQIKKTPIYDDDWVVFTSSSSVKNFFESELYRGQKILCFCIGEITAGTVLEYQPKEMIRISDQATSESLIEKMVEG